LPTDKIIKIAALNVGIAVLNIILFSPGLIGLAIGGVSTVATALGITSILVSVGVFVYGNYKMIAVKEKLMISSEIKTPEDYMKALRQHSGSKTFGKEVSVVVEQIDRISRKTGTMKDILLQKFSNTEMSYTKFEATITAVEGVFYTNIRSILNKLNAFDEVDYNEMKKSGLEKKFSAEFIQSKMSIFNEYILFVQDAIEHNEEIILKLDKLLLEISKFNSLEASEIENMSGMKEIDELIRQAKLYK